LAGRRTKPEEIFVLLQRRPGADPDALRREFERVDGGDADEVHTVGAAHALVLMAAGPDPNAHPLGARSGDRLHDAPAFAQ